MFAVLSGLYQAGVNGGMVVVGSGAAVGKERREDTVREKLPKRNLVWTLTVGYMGS